MLDMIVSKIIRDLTLNMKNRESEEGQESDSRISKNQSISSNERK